MLILMRGRAVVARRAHNPEVLGSNPSPATKVKPESNGLWFFVNLACSCRHYSNNGGISYKPQFDMCAKIKSFTLLSEGH